MCDKNDFPIFMAITIVCATVCLAELASANIVGYNTVTLKKGYNMLAVNFEDVTSTDGISIQKLGFTLEAGLTGGANAVAGDQIQVYSAESGEYTTYFLYNNARQPQNAKNGKWCTSTGAEANDVTFKNGDSFWYLKRGEGDAIVAISGAVSMNANQEITIVKGYNMIGSAFPANFNPNDFGQDYWKSAIAAGAVGGANAVAGDQLQVYDAAKGEYTTYFLYNNARQATNAKNGKWCTSTGTEIAVGTEVLPVGKGAWYLHRGNGFTLTAPSPVK